MHEALHLHREPLWRGEHAVRHQVRFFTADHRDARRLSEAPVLPLRQCAERDDAIGESGDDRRGAVGDSGATAASAAAPLHRRRAQLTGAQRRRQPRGFAAIVAERREAVDVARIDSGIGTSRQDRLQCEFEFRIGRLAVAVISSLADADDGDASAKRTRAAHGGVSAGSCGCTGSPNAPAFASASRRASSYPRTSRRTSRVSWPTSGAGCGSASGVTE